jgi:hypothetical protein
MDELRKVARTMALVFFVISAVGLGVKAYEGWSEARAAEAVEREKDAVGSQASLTARVLVSAFRRCEVIGVPDLSRCVTHKGPLIEERLAPSLAEQAIQMKKDYDAACTKHNSAEYCRALLQRASEVAARTREHER